VTSPSAREAPAPFLAGRPHPDRLSPADKVVVSYLAVVAVLILVAMSRVDYWWWIVEAHIAAIAAVLLIARLPPWLSEPGSRFARVSHAWYPVILIPFTYAELEYLIPRIHPYDFDLELAAIDRWIFGTDPTVWLERVTWPALTELFQISYVTYYFLPLTLAIVLWRKGWFEEFYFLVFAVVLAFYLSYLGYIAVPAIGPRFILSDRQSFPLEGVLLFDWIRTTLNRAEGITRDCFPSGHTMLTIVVLECSRRFHKPTFWALMPAGTALILSTVYLRYHYVIDVIAGGLLGVVMLLFAGRLYRVLGGSYPKTLGGSEARH
jgi:membrane-associated phospholipid phosphatase